ncbi:apolipoprotein D isoform X4 [Strigops habroptila]|uniref:apolipoprotein D isoform X4 n=1 Tax=Strigops habroptila TaxID=2489341 RepID=UPI0011D022BA|nr:apolipoprotein D isoform X4 [Strigops habroptila]
MEMSVREEKTPAEEKAVLITGCDKGFGHALAKQVRAEGFTCFAGYLLVASPSITCVSQMASLVLRDQFRHTESEGVADPSSQPWRSCRSVGPGEQCWHLTFREVEFASLNNYKKVAEINLWGTVRVTKAFLPSFPELKNRDPSGSSLQGLRPWQQLCQAGQGTFLRAQQNHCWSCMIGFVP